MKGLVVNGDGTLRLAQDIPMPELGDYMAIVKTVACGICNGTDLKLVEGHLNHYHTFPAVLGHESTGRVVECGKRVRHFRPGDLVLRSGLEDMAPPYYSLWGSFAEYGRVVDCKAMEEDGLSVDPGLITQQIVPEGIDAVDAVMLITLKEIRAALNRLGVSGGARVAISGCGPVGLAMVRFCKLMGASFIALSGHHDHRIEVARRMGADLAVNSKKENFAQTVKARCPKMLDFYIDAVGRCEIVSEALTLIQDNGTIGVYGIGLEEEKGIRWNAGPYNWKLHSVQWPVPQKEYEVHDEVVEYVRNEEIDLKDFVTHRLTIEEYEEGFSLVRNRQGLKVALCFEE